MAKLVQKLVVLPLDLVQKLYRRGCRRGKNRGLTVNWTVATSLERMQVLICENGSPRTMTLEAEGHKHRCVVKSIFVYAYFHELETA